MKLLEGRKIVVYLDRFRRNVELELLNYDTER
jgi:hypothetical protein